VRQLLSLALLHDQDVVTARQRAAVLAGLTGFEPAEQTRFATAVSEIVRNAWTYARGGEVAYGIDEESAPQALVVMVTDRGPGIRRLDDVLAGRAVAASGSGTGIMSARRLLDGFEMQSSTAGTSVVMRKRLPSSAPALTRDGVATLARRFSAPQPKTLAEEYQQQNQELLRAFEELRSKQQELVRLNRELEDTNRGVVALYAELDDKAEDLRRAAELKSRFLSNMTHEFRTPVNSIIGLCNLLDESSQKENRGPEPEISYIRKAAEQLSELVNDLLDLAKVEAGRSELRLGACNIEKLFGTLRGMLRPLLANASVNLVFEEAGDLPDIVTDESKISQILRNLVSNALKFTERGEVRVSARRIGEHVAISVADTGIGIHPEDHERIFEEFIQLENALQPHTRGTGLGLSLSRRLSELLGGTLEVESSLGTGSIFTLTLPVAGPGPGPTRVLVIDDQEVSRFVIAQCLDDNAFEITEATTGQEGLRLAQAGNQDVVLLDLMLPDMHGREVLAKLRAEPDTSSIPIVIVTATALDGVAKTRLLDWADAVLSKAELSRITLGSALREVLGRKSRAPRSR
jgi:signal transduction histidine kinase